MAGRRGEGVHRRGSDFSLVNGGGGGGGGGEKIEKVPRLSYGGPVFFALANATNRNNV